MVSHGSFCHQTTDNSWNNSHFLVFFQLQKKWVQKVTFVVWLTSNPFLYLYKNGFQWRILFLAPSATSKSEKWWKVLRVFRERSMIFRVMFQAFLGLVHYWYIHQLSESVNFLLETIRYTFKLYSVAELLSQANLF